MSENYCRAGHPYTEGSWSWQYGGKGSNPYKQCRQCNANAARAFRQRRKDGGEWAMLPGTAARAEARLMATWTRLCDAAAGR